jgi:hypothetical protein
MSCTAWFQPMLACHGVVGMDKNMKIEYPIRQFGNRFKPQLGPDAASLCSWARWADLSLQAHLDQRLPNLMGTATLQIYGAMDMSKYRQMLLRR